MEKILNFLKKFIAILTSLIYGVFKKEETKKDYNQEEQKSVEHDKKKYDKSSKIIVSDEDRGEKSRQSFSDEEEKEEIDEKLNEETIYYAKRDIQRLLFIQKKLIKLENDIKNCNSLDEIYELETEYREAKIHFDKIADIYDKEKLDIPIIKDIKNVIKDTERLIKSNKVLLDDKKYELKNRKEVKEEPKKIVKVGEEENKEIEEEKNDAEKETSVVEETIEKEAKTIVGIEEEHLVHDVIDEDEKIETNEELVEEIETHDVEIDNKVEVNTEAKKQNTKEIISKVATVGIVAEAVNIINENKNNKNLQLIAGIIARARSLASSSNPSMLLQMNPMVAVSSTLFINNEVKRARTLADNRPRKLTLNKVVDAVGLNPALQVRFIMTNSIKEIRKLKNELRKYGDNEEILNALNELDELEMEIMMQLNELQNQNNHREERHR